MKTLLKIFKNSIFVVALLSGFMLLPKISSLLRDKNYIENEIVPLHDTDFNSYLEKVASYHSFYYEKEPLFEERTFENNNYKITIVAYSVSYYQKGNIIDTMQFFVKDATIKGKTFSEIKPTLIFQDPIYDKKDSDKFITELSLNTIKTDSYVKSFWAGDAKNKADGNFNKLKGIQLRAKDSPESDFIPLLAISDEVNLTDRFIFSTNLTENCLVKENYNLSTNVSSNDNIPTNSEVENLKIYYKEFDFKELKPYNKIIYISYTFYSLLLAAIFYLFYVHKNLMIKIKQKN